MDSTKKFRHHVNGAAGIYHRMDSGENTGRNREATYEYLTWHVQKAREILAAACQNDSDTLPEYLDTPRGKRLAASWDRIEHRFYGLR